MNIEEQKVYKNDQNKNKNTSNYNNNPYQQQKYNQSTHQQQQQYPPPPLELKKKISFGDSEDFEIDELDLPGFDQFMTLYNTSVHSNRNFRDSEFPPSSQSLYDPLSQRGRYLWQQLVWLRPIDFFAGKIKVFQKLQAVTESRIDLGSYISPYDIKQGALGDCYFLSALSSMADTPESILKLFKTQVTNTAGIYCMKLYDDGQWKAVYVDDYFPCYNAVYGPAFTKSNGNELWVLLLEKAWAKMFGSYERIDAGMCREALNALTGAPTKIELTEDARTGKVNEKLRDILIDAIMFKGDD